MKNLKEILLTVLFKGSISMPHRKFIGILCYYIIPILVLISVILGGREVAMELGNSALSLFFITILSGPLSTIIPSIKFLRLVKTLRRELGVLSFWIVVVHGLGIAYIENILSWKSIQSLLSLDSLYLWGFLGLIGMTYLGITSNNIGMKMLKSFWKKSHMYVVYFTMIFSVIHVILADEGGQWVVLSILYIALKVFVWKRKKIEAE